jgi:DNA replication protein DnaC
MDRSPEDPTRSLQSIMLGATLTRLCESLGERETSCETHGSYMATGARYMGRHEVWTPCPACEEERLAGERHAQAQQRAEQTRRELDRAIGQAAIPARFIGRTLENFQAETDAQREALRVARHFVEHFEEQARRGQGLIFSGLPGTGKSHLAAAILQAIMPRHVGLYATCMNLIRAVRGTWRRDSERGETEVLDTFANVPLLVLDEIGAQYGTDGEQTILFDVLDRRYRDMRPSILLTNQDSQGLREFVGERSYDRLRETAQFVVFDWPSYRPHARRQIA